MTIQEAIKSGKPFRRKACSRWNNRGEAGIFFHKSDVLADDWEIKQEPREWNVKVCLQTGQIYPPEVSMGFSPIGECDVIKVREVIE